MLLEDFKLGDLHQMSCPIIVVATTWLILQNGIDADPPDILSVEVTSQPTNNNNIMLIILVNFAGSLLIQQPLLANPQKGE